MPRQQSLTYRINSFLLATLAVTAIGFTSLNKAPTQLIESTTTEFNAAEEVKNQYYKDLEKFVNQLDLLKEAVVSEQNNQTLRRRLLNAREQFKRCEYLLSYIDNNFTKQINGPTIRRAEGTASTGPVYYEPHGLQVMEEMIFGTDPINQSSILQEVATVRRLVEQMLAAKIKIQHGQANSMNAVIWDALRHPK